jgi:membrane protein
MPPNLRAFFADAGELFKNTFKEWYRKDPFRESAVIAYYAVFSIPGLLVLLITIVGYFFGKEAVSASILEQVSSIMGLSIATQIKEMLIAGAKTQSTFWGATIGISTILVGATGVFVELQKAFNLIWEVKVVPSRGILPILKVRFFSFGLILAIAFLLTISLVISTALAAMSKWIEADSALWIINLLKVVNFIISLGVISTLFGLMFKILPDAKIKWKHVWLGSLVTGSLFTIGKTVLGFYFGKVQPGSSYGAAGSVVLILLWVSYSSMIMFLGAEFTAAYAKMYSNKVAPTEIARVTSNT